MTGRVLHLYVICGAFPQAYHAFTDDQRRQLRRHLAALHHAPIDTLEFIGGTLLPIACIVCGCLLSTCAHAQQSPLGRVHGCRALLLSTACTGLYGHQHYTHVSSGNYSAGRRRRSPMRVGRDLLDTVLCATHLAVALMSRPCICACECAWTAHIWYSSCVLWPVSVAHFCLCVRKLARGASLAWHTHLNLNFEA
jgi:hypothetical protein